MIDKALAGRILAGEISSAFLYPDTENNKRPGPDFDAALYQLLSGLRKLFPKIKVKGNGRTESYAIDFTGIESSKLSQLITMLQTSEVSIEDIDHAADLFQ